jgi:hypothetical protein
MVGEKLAAAQQKLRQEVDRLTSGKQSEVLNQFASSKNGVLGPLAAQQKVVTDKIAEIQSLLKQKQDALTQAADQQKKQAEDAVKNKVQDQLQNLFKR